MSASLVPSDPPDVELLTRIARGEGEAFAGFYDRHSSLFYALILRILRNEREAEDVLQEACLLIWERAAHYDPRLGKPLSWAITLIRNKAIDRLRSVRRQEQLHDEISDDLPAVSEAGEPAGDEAVLIRRAMAELSPEQRQAIELAFFSGLTHLEIAAKLGAPAGTIKARIRRGMMTMRDVLEDQL